MLHTKVDFQCDKLATELSGQCLRRSMYSSCSKLFVDSRQFNRPDLHMASLFRVTTFEFC